MARGLMVYPMGGTIDGVRGDHVLLAPPFIVDRERQMSTLDRRTSRAMAGRSRHVRDMRQSGVTFAIKDAMTTEMEDAR